MALAPYSYDCKFLHLLKRLVKLTSTKNNRLPVDAPTCVCATASQPVGSPPSPFDFAHAGESPLGGCSVVP